MERSASQLEHCVKTIKVNASSIRRDECRSKLSVMNDSMIRLQYIMPSVCEPLFATIAPVCAILSTSTTNVGLMLSVSIAEFIFLKLSFCASVSMNSCVTDYVNPVQQKLIRLTVTAYLNLDLLI